MLTIARKIPLIRHFAMRPRLGLALLLGGLCSLMLPLGWSWTTRALIGWDGALALYLCLAVGMMHGADKSCMRKRAEDLDEGQIFILLFTILTACASLAAIFIELGVAKQAGVAAEWPHILLAGFTVFLSWTFVQIIFALHYAHEYYGGEDTAAGLDFPGECDDPDYWDFVYFSCIIGTAAQTADVAITKRAIRRVVTLHCSAVFLFNTTILALTINIGASLL